jgi:hypothetical protein
MTHLYNFLDPLMTRAYNDDFILFIDNRISYVIIITKRPLWTNILYPKPGITIFTETLL